MEYKDHIDQSLFEEIEAYLLQTMPAMERTRFELRLEEDPALQNELRLQQQLMALAQVRSFAPASASASVPASQGSAGAKPPGKLIPFRRGWWAAAAILLVVAGIWFLRPDDSPDTLATRYFKADPGLPVTMSSTLDYQFYDGMVSYKEGNYDKAIQIWLGLAGASDTLRYYIGMAYINQARYPDALNQLLPLTKIANEWQEKATWFAAIGYLRLNQPEAAATLLKTIPNYPPAKELLKELQRKMPDKNS